MTGAEAVERTEGSAGLDNPRAGAGRTANQVRNNHPTVKAIGIMTALLEDVPNDPDDPCVVLDPFMGSGTTGIACIETGHSFIGIEREEPYMKIATARVTHWAEKKGTKLNGSKPVVVSDSERVKEVETILDLDWLF